MQIIEEQRLTHLNIDNCLPTLEILKQVVKVIKKSKTLQAAHISRTPTDKTIMSRYLGNSEIANNHRFVFSRHCWICEKWRPIIVVAESEQVPTITGEGAIDQLMQPISK